LFSSSLLGQQQDQKIAEMSQKIQELEQELSQRKQDLLSRVAPENISQATIPISELQRRSYKSRSERDPQKFGALVASIRDYGFRGTIWVQKKPDGSLWIIGGETRTDAALVAGLSEIAADIMEVDDLTAAKLCRAENNRRQNLNELDDTNEIIYLLSLMLKKTREEVIASLYQYRNAAAGKASIDPEIKQAIEEGFKELEPTLSLITFIANRLRLLNLPPDILEAYQKGQIGQIKALELAKVTDEQARRELLDKVITEDLSVSQIRNLVKTNKPTKHQSVAQIQSKLTKTKQQVESLIPNDPGFVQGLSQEERKQLEATIAELKQLLQEKESLLGKYLVGGI
jgi:ParB family chromosome partitioning protein